jgi:hypothetical protein
MEPQDERARGGGLGPRFGEAGPLRESSPPVPLRASKKRIAGVAQPQSAFDSPVLVVWAFEDRVMPRDHGRRLAG